MLFRSPAIVEYGGVTIGIIGATDNEPGWAAGPDTPGTNYFSVDNPSHLLGDIKKLRPDVDILIVTLQWGPNKRQRPTQEYIQAAHAIIDAGADTIHGHSAHIFQGIEVYGGKLILYDTGDFVDDYAVCPDLRNDQSFLFVVHADKQGVRTLELLPTRIANMQVNLADPDEARQIVSRMQRLSEEMGTDILASDDGTRAYVEIANR